MPTKGIFYGSSVVLLALLLVSSSFALMFYDRYQWAASEDQHHLDELSATLASYRTLQGSYNASLTDYNRTLTLLEAGVANLNTSTTAYKEASAAIASLWASYRNLASLSGGKVVTYGVSMLINFGNGTRRWYNDTSIQPGLNAYLATVVLLRGNIQATWYPQYQEHFVGGVSGVQSGRTNSWFIWEHGKGGWHFSQSGADSITVYNGTSFAWTLCGYDASFNPVCSP